MAKNHLLTLYPISHFTSVFASHPPSFHTNKLKKPPSRMLLLVSLLRPHIFAQALYNLRAISLVVIIYTN